MRSIHRCSELEGLIRVKDEKLEVGKGVAAEFEDLQVKVSSLRAELEHNATKVACLSDEWTEKVADLERKVIKLERSKEVQVAAATRAATREDTMCILRSE